MSALHRLLPLSLVVVIALGIFSNGSSFAQSFEAPITGSVVGPANEPLAGVIVKGTLLDGTNNVVSTQTDINGTFQLNVFNGNWLVDVQCQGEEGVKARGYNCVSSQTASVSTTNGTTVNFSATVRVPLEITTTELAEGKESAFYTTALNASGGTGGYAWEISPDSDPLPPGLNFSSDEISANIFGTPQTNGSFTVIVRVMDGDLTVTEKTFLLAITPASRLISGRITDNSGSAVTNIQIFAHAVDDTGFTQAATDVTGNFVLRLNEISYRLSFDPNALASRGLMGFEWELLTSYPSGAPLEFQLRRATSQIRGSVRKANGEGVEGLSVEARMLESEEFWFSDEYSVTTTDAEGNFTLLALNGIWSVLVNENDLFNLGYKSIASNLVTIPPTNVTINFTAQTVLPEIATTGLPNGVTGVSYSRSLQAQGGQSPYSWAIIEGDLPPGLKLATNGVISGTPTKVGHYEFIAQVTDSNDGTSERGFAIFISSKPPVILTQPTSHSAFPGESTSFSVSATGAATLRYQWRFKGTNIPGATTSAYNINNVEINRQGNYSVVVTNAFGKVTSANAFLTVNLTASITTQPADHIAYVGRSTSLSVVASGTAPLSYQWSFNNEPLTDATNASLTITNLQTSHEGNYFVTVSNSFGIATSSNAVLTVHFPVSIDSHPEAVSVRRGSSVSFHVSAWGTQPLHYQWQFNGANIFGATNFMLTISNVQPARVGSYRVIVSNGGGAVPSQAAQLQVYNCAYSLSTNLVTLYAQNSGSVALMTSNDCDWAVGNVPDWIQVSPTNGTGPTMIHFSMEYHTNAAPRIADFTIAGLPFRVVQLGFVAPASIAGKTLRLPGPDYGGHLFVTRRGTNTFQLIPLPTTEGPSPTLLPETGTYIYQRTGISASLQINSLGFHLTFTDSPTSGGYQIEDANNPDNQENGTFTMFDTKPDFNEDGWTDILFQKPNAPIVVWRMFGTSFDTSAALRTAPAGWRIMGQYDFNNDGHVDLLWQHDSTKLAVWHMNGEAYMGSVSLRGGAAAGAGWRAVGVADFDGNDSADILFQHTDGRLAVWFMEGETYQRTEVLRNGLRTSSNWQVAGVNDFNGDAQPDILWRHHNGQLAIWYMAGSTFINSAAFRTGLPVASGWQIVGFSDFDLNGNLDILWQQNSKLAVWLLSGASYNGNVTLAKPVAGGWTVVGPK